MNKLMEFVYMGIAVLLITGVLFAPAYLFLVTQTDEKIALHSADKLTQARIQFSAVLDSYDMLAKNIYENVINKENINSLIKQANAEDEAGKAILREKLYESLLPLYKNLKQHSVRQLHFYLKNSVSFLRFQQPEKFGDSLEGVRYSIDKVNRTMRPEFGFEEGYDLNGFRHVFPIIYQNKFCGTVEIAYAFDTVKNELDRLQKAHYSFIIQKRLISERALKKSTQNYLPSELSDEYLLDKSVYDVAPSTGLDQADINTLNQKISPHIQQKLHSEQPFLYSAVLANKHYLLIFIPILNVENKQVAYAVVYEKSPALDLIAKNFKVEQYAAALVSLLLAALFVLYYTSQRKTAKALRLLATTDSLTQLANRNHLNLVLKKSIQVSQRYQLPLSLIFFDIDHFKKINDAHGHDAGDTVLSSIGLLMSHHVRTSDLLARWGGEEFMILLPETERKNARLLAEKLRQLIEEYKFLPNVEVTCSFGVTQLHKDDTEESLLKRVDAALYTAKEQGRNMVIELP